MNLVFYSGGLAEENAAIDQKLLAMTGKASPSLAFIPAGPFDHEEDFVAFTRQYRDHGIRQFLHCPIDRPISSPMRRALFESDVIQIGGGNTFYLLKHLRRAKLFGALRAFVKRGGVLCGVSAGSICMTPSIVTASFPSFDCDSNDVNLRNLRALNLAQFEFFPHYVSSLRYDDELKAYSRSLSWPLYSASDGSAIICQARSIEMIGTVCCFFKGNKVVIRGGYL